MQRLMKWFLKNLFYKLRAETKKQYNRVNPFFEDIIDWKEKGEFCSANKNVIIYDSTTIIGNIVIKDHVWVGPFCLLDGGGGLYIGEFTDISTGCQILTHDTIRCALSGGKQPYEYAPVHIGKCCFIGTHTVILKGVTLEDYCLVAANSVVNKSFPSYSIVGGMPATQIGKVVMLEDGRINFEYFEKGM